MPEVLSPNQRAMTSERKWLIAAPNNRGEYVHSTQLMPSNLQRRLFRRPCDANRALAAQIERVLSHYDRYQAALLGRKYQSGMSDIFEIYTR